MMTTNTPHAATCRRAFGRLDAECPRCQELQAGAPARSWRGSRRAEQQLQRIAEIRAHDCRASKCGPVCTAFDW